MKTLDNVSLHFRPFKVNYIGPSNVRGPRVKIHDMRNGITRFIEYDCAASGGANDQAIAFLEERGITVDALACADDDGGSMDGIILLSTNFSKSIRSDRKVKP